MIPKEAGFRWDNTRIQWVTDQVGIAARLRSYFDSTAENEIKRVLIVNEPWTGQLWWPSHLKPLPFQENAALFALARNRSYLALDPGLGKTIVAATVRNALNVNSEKPVITVIICPPFLARNTEAEFEKWSPPRTTIQRYGHSPHRCPDVLIIPDSIVHKLDVQRHISDMLQVSGRPSLLIVDEAHRFKSYEAQRTKAVFTLTPQFERVVFLSGTPMPNRPIELYPVLHHCAPQTIQYMNKFQYGMRYCNGSRGDWGWDFTGASHMSELAAQVHGTFMLRLKKKDVLPELPPKTEELVFLEEDMPARLVEMDRKLLAQFSPEDLMGHLAVNGHVATYRKELGITKVPSAAQFILDVLSSGEESVLVFAIHKQVIAGLSESLKAYQPLVITGETPMDVRHTIVKEFQENPFRRLFMGNIQAAGTGLTLTKATRVIFVEYSWVPAENEQASDRAHRIGQKDNVFVQYLVYKNSIDRSVLETVSRKKIITNHV